MPNILILTGAVAAGKNTIAHRYALSHKKCADIDMDLVRWMLRQPHQAMWDVEAINSGYRQHKLAIKQGCMLAKSFIDEGYDVIITDVVLPELVAVYEQHLHNHTYKIVKLLPMWETCLKRLHERPPTIGENEARWCYDKQVALSHVDLTIDNTHRTPDKVVKQLLDFMK